MYQICQFTNIVNSGDHNPLADCLFVIDAVPLLHIPSSHFPVIFYFMENKYTQA